jgi:hypothetical protein
MAQHHYIVAQDGSRWKISFHGTDQGPYTCKEDAVAAAIKEAKAAAIDIEVLVQDVDRKFHSAWSAEQR